MRIAERVFLAAVLLCFAVPTVVYTVRVVRGEKDILMLPLQCACGILGVLIPGLAVRSGWLRPPRAVRVVYLAFLFCAVFLAEVCGFYETVPHWDTALHLVSAGMFAVVGFSVAAHFAGEENAARAAGLTAVFAFCFAFALGGLWEFYEFAGDTVLGMNMQRFLRPDGTPLSGRDALWDTMKDLFADAFGAAVTCAGCGMALRHGAARAEGFLIRFGRTNGRETPAGREKK